MSMAQPFQPSIPTARDLPHGGEEPSAEPAPQPRAERPQEQVFRTPVPGATLSNDELDDDLAGSEPTG